MADDWPDHHCPSCGVPRKPFPRYPWHLCNDCRESACDGDGKGLRFFNPHLTGGLGFQIVTEGTLLRPINITVQYLSAGKSQASYAKGRVTKLGRRSANLTVEAWQDDRSRPIATFGGARLEDQR